MQVYKMFFKIAKKHMTQCFIFSGIFVMLIIFMSFSGQDSMTQQYEDESVEIVIVDEDKSEISEGLAEYLSQRHNIVELKDYEKETIADNLFYQRIHYVLTIPEGFGENFLMKDDAMQLEYSMRKDNAKGYFLNVQVDSYLDNVNLYLTGGYDCKEAIALTNASMEDASTVELVRFEEYDAGENNIMYFYFQYYCYIIFMIFALALAPILMVFKKKDISNRIACSAISDKEKNTQLGLACLTYSLVMWAVFMLVALVLFGADAMFSTGGLMCIANALLYTLLATGMILLLSAFRFDDNALNLVANILGLGMSFITGVFVQQWLLGEEVLTVGKFLPSYWYIKIVNMTSGWSGESLLTESFLKYMGIQVVFLVAIFSVYLVLNSQKVKKREQ